MVLGEPLVPPHTNKQPLCPGPGLKQSSEGKVHGLRGHRPHTSKVYMKSGRATGGGRRGLGKPSGNPTSTMLPAQMWGTGT